MRRLIASMFHHCVKYGDVPRLSQCTLVFMLLILISVVSAKGESFLSLGTETNADKLEWDSDGRNCKDSLSDISFAPPGSKGLASGELTLSSVSIGQMSEYHASNSTNYEKIPVKSHDLKSLNRYGRCLGLDQAANVMDWAEKYHKHLGAESKCDGALLNWKACGGFIDVSDTEQETNSNVIRRDFVMYVPTVRRRVNLGFSDSPSFEEDRHFSAAVIELNKNETSVRAFWKSIVQAEKELTNGPASKVAMDSLFDAPSNLTFLVKWPLAVVCVCNNRHPPAENFNSSQLANDILNLTAILSFREPLCQCHSMDPKGSVSCPRILSKQRVIGSVYDISENVKFVQREESLYTYGVKRDAPYLRPYVSQNGQVRCQTSIEGDSEHGCSGKPTVGDNGEDLKLVSCAVDSNSLAHISPVQLPRGPSGVDFERPLRPTRLVSLLRLMLDGEKGYVSVASSLSRSKDPTGATRSFEENFVEKIRAGPQKLRPIELILLVALPTFVIFGHLTYKLCRIKKHSRRSLYPFLGSALLAVGDLVLEAITAGYLWRTVYVQKKWRFERCHEVPVFGVSSAFEIATIEMLVTHCTLAKVHTDIVAAYLASAGAVFALFLVVLEIGPFAYRRVLRKLE